MNGMWTAGNNNNSFTLLGISRSLASTTSVGNIKDVQSQPHLQMGLHNSN